MLAAILLAGCTSTPPGAHLDPALATLIPADAVLLSGVHVERLIETPFFQDYVAGRVESAAFPMIEQVAERTGVNPTEDIWEVLAISNGETNAVLARGDFSDGVDPWTVLQQQGVPIFSYRGYTFAGDEANSVLFMNPSLAGVGDTAMLKSIIDTRDQTNGPPEILAAQMAEIPSDSTMWAVYRSGGFAIPTADWEGNLANVATVLESVQAGRIYTDLSLGFAAHATGVTATEDGARQLHDALRAAVGLGRLMTPPDQQEVIKLYDTIQVTQEAQQVNLHMNVPDDSIRAMLELLDNFVPLGAAPAE